MNNPLCALAGTVWIAWVPVVFGQALLPGIKGEYFGNSDLSGTPIVTRFDSKVQFFWPDTNPPDIGVPGDGFSVRWSGKVIPPTSETYTFYVDADDGVRLRVNGQLILDQWNPNPDTYYNLRSNPVALTGQQAADIQVDFQDFFSDAYIVVSWQTPTRPKEVIGDSYYFRASGSSSITITGPTADVHSIRGAWNLIDIEATSASGEKLAVSATGLPPGVSVVTKYLNPTTIYRQWLAGNPSPQATGSYSVTLSAESQGATAQQNFTWIIDPDNTAPTVNFASFPVTTGRSPGPYTATPGARITPLPNGNFLIGLAASELLLELTLDDFFVSNGEIISATVGQAVHGPLGGSADLFALPPAPRSEYYIEVRPTANGPVDVTFPLSRAVTDYSGNWNDRGAQATYYYNVDPPGGITITGPSADVHSIRGAWSLIEVGARTASGSTIEVSATGLPPGINLVTNNSDPSNILQWLAGNPTAQATGTYSVTLSATSQGTSAQKSFAWVIDTDTVGPVFQFTSFQVHEAGPRTATPGTRVTPIGPSAPDFLVGLSSSDLLLGLTTADFAVTNGVIQSTSVAQAMPIPVPGSAAPLPPRSEYWVVIRPQSAGPVQVSLPPAVATDYSGNANASGAQATYYYNVDPPGNNPDPGLRAEYYSNDKLQGTPVLTRIDSSINAFWPETTSPGPGVPGDYFSVRWTGQIRPRYSEPYTFTMDADDGVRLYINGVLLLDHWNPQPNTYYGLQSTPFIFSSANSLYDIRVEFQDFFSDAYIALRWRSASQQEETIPASRLFQPASTATPAIANAEEVLLAPTFQGGAPSSEVPFYSMERQNDGRMSFVFAQPLDGSKQSVQTSPDLKTWRDLPLREEWSTSDATRGVLVRIPLNSQGRQFFRLRHGEP